MKNTTNYAELLPEGKENRITANELMAALGFTDCRSLRADIAKARIAGQVILSTSEGTGGYYLPGSDDEVREFIRSYSAQALSLLRALKSARQYLAKDDAQLTIADIIAEWDLEGDLND